MSPSQADADRIRPTLGVVVEILEALVKLSSDTRTAEALRAEGNGEPRGPTRVDVERIVETAEGALAALRGRELDTEELKTIRTNLAQQSVSMQQFFEQRAEAFTPRPVEKAVGHVVTGGMLAGLLDAVSAFDQLLNLLDDLHRRTGEDHGSS